MVNLDAYIATAKSVLQEPDKFFGKLKAGDMGEVLTYYAILAFVSGIIGSILAGPVAAVGAAIGTTVGGIIFLFIFAAVVSFIAKLMGGKGDFNITLRAMGYASTAGLLGNAFNVIPLIGQLIALLGQLYGLYLNIMGVAKVHKIETWKAAVAVLVPGAILLAIVFFFVATVMVAVMGAGMLGMLGMGAMSTVG